MSSSNSNIVNKLTLSDAVDLTQFFGHLDHNLRLIEENFAVEISARGKELQLEGTRNDVERVELILREMERYFIEGKKFRKEHLYSIINHYSQPKVTAKDKAPKGNAIPLKRKTIYTMNPAQQLYVDRIRSHDLTFGIGPAGTGKTYLAVAMAVSAMLQGTIERIILTRPAVEAGEKLGFLPGDLFQKVDPYLRPLYDALYEMLGVEKVSRSLERGQIEIAPLAFMRGRTLNDSFIILDEAQNTTSEQMKMFLTRLGYNSKAVVTGDITQIDLPGGRSSGLVEVQNILKDIKAIAFVRFTKRDVVRHKLVQSIVEAYEKHEHRKITFQERKDQRED